ncbi:hypothetical protein QCA50_018544 [Cerrena zonata]|uniref:Uncharacterized protein n=1 Tax=Cerrena zonata TaxID=2478898 RepID=A0AAW0FHR6_9APHY
MWCEDRKTVTLLHGYCVSRHWLLDYNTKILGGDPEQPDTCPSYMYLRPVVGMPVEEACRRDTLVPTTQIYTHLVKTEDGGWRSCMDPNARDNLYGYAEVIGSSYSECPETMVDAVFDPNHEYVNKLKKILFMDMGTEPHWYWQSVDEDFLLPQPWTPDCGKIVRYVRRTASRRRDGFRPKVFKTPKVE